MEGLEGEWEEGREIAEEDVWKIELKGCRGNRWLQT